MTGHVPRMVKQEEHRKF